MLSPSVEIEIVPLVSAPLFIQADDLRVMAESGSDPKAYELAAREFDKLGMIAAASRLREKAAHYRSLTS